MKIVQQGLYIHGKDGGTKVEILQASLPLLLAI